MMDVENLHTGHVTGWFDDASTHVLPKSRGLVEPNQLGQLGVRGSS